MKFKIIICILILQCSFFRAQILKEVTYDLLNGTTIWNGQVNVVPCIESFTLKVVNILPATTTATITLFNSSGGNGTPVNMSTPPIAVYTVIAATSGQILTTAINNLSFKRYYYIAVETQTSAGSPIQSNTVQVYSTASNKELIYFEFFGGVGDAAFFNSPDDKEDRAWGHNVSVATGLKFRYWPTSNNGNYAHRHVLYPKGSPWSLVIAAVINDTRYRSTNIKPLIIGLKPLIGVNYEVKNIFGITLGAVIGNQELKAHLNSQPNYVAGVWLGVSFSLAVFQAFRNSLPAIGLPTGPGTQ